MIAIIIELIRIPIEIVSHKTSNKIIQKVTYFLKLNDDIIF